MADRTPKRLDMDALWAYALKTLSARGHSIGELRQKLKGRAERETDVVILIDRLKDCGYLNDALFAENFAASRLSDGDYGRTRVILELRQRRVPADLAQQIVDRIFQGVDDEARIEDWLRRKYRTAEREGLFQSQKEMSSVYKRLIRAGFGTGPSLRVLKRFAANPELLDGVDEVDLDRGDAEALG